MGCIRSCRTFCIDKIQNCTLIIHKIKNTHRCIQSTQFRYICYPQTHTKNDPSSEQNAVHNISVSCHLNTTSFALNRTFPRKIYHRALGSLCNSFKCAELSKRPRLDDVESIPCSENTRYMSSVADSENTMQKDGQFVCDIQTPLPPVVFFCKLFTKPYTLKTSS